MEAILKRLLIFLQARTKLNNIRDALKSYQLVLFGNGSLLFRPIWEFPDLFPCGEFIHVEEDCPYLRVRTLNGVSRYFQSNVEQLDPTQLSGNILRALKVSFKFPSYDVQCCH